MKKSVRKWLAVMLCGSSLLAMPGVIQAKPAAKAAKPAAAQPAETAVKEIRLVHRLSPEGEEALRQLVARFNEANKDYQVVVQQGDWSEQDSPHLAILQGDDMDGFLAGKARYKPLATMMREAGVPLQALKTPLKGPLAMAPTLVDGKGQLLALPVGLSTPVLYINRTAFQRAGLDPDAPLKTWLDLQQALGRLATNGSACPYTVSQPSRVMIENTSAWHNEPVATRRGKVDAPSFNGMLQVKHIAMMASWHRARYLRIFGGESEAEQNFASGECAVIAAPSERWTKFRRGGGFEVAIAPLPYYDDFPGAPQNTVADGAALWASAGKKPAEYKAMARFIAFWLQPDNQVAWLRESGYLPLNRAGLLAAQSDVLGPDFDNVRVAVAQITNKPATIDSAASPVVSRSKVRSILDEELAAVWEDRKPAKEALDTAVMRASALPPAR